MREVITLQFGHSANFIGTHFWNTQDAYFTYDPAAPPPELMHDVLYRTGMSQQGIETYTPRALIYDLKGGFGSLSKYNRLYEDKTTESNLEGNVVKYEQERHPKNSFLQTLEEEEETGITNEAKNFNLDKEVKVWSDFNRTTFHPRSLHQLLSHSLDSSILPFSAFPVGLDAFQEYERDHASYDDSLRHFAEECDQLQGFHVMVSTYDAWGGFATGILESVRDEFSKAGIWVYGLGNLSPEPYENLRKSQMEPINEALSMVRLGELASVYVPLRRECLDVPWPKLSFNPKLLYHTTAVLSAAIETASLPFRTRQDPTSMGQLAGLYNWRSSIPLASLSVAMPLGDAEHFHKSDIRSLTTTKKEDPYSQSLVIRGLEKSDAKKRLEELQDQNEAISAGQLVHTAFPTASPYPKIFEQDTSPLPQTSVAMLTRLAASNTLAHNTASLLRAINEVNFSAHVEYRTDLENSIGEDEWREVKSTLADLLDAYRGD
ncbi:uncharacterized protein VTP21DRAFT_7928 [Calcarisporiella thermophila]|uniref:uncharacterized protein n=1 Tax=Calcarisporiella thermophila TaxID=911321 RepID=UPI0037441B46